MKYEIQNSDYGYVVNDSLGNFVLETATYEEAQEWIENNKDKYADVAPKIDLYEQFVIYCKKLPGKCFLDRKLASTNEKALNRFIQSFEKARNVKIRTGMECYGGEYFFIVDDVIEN